MSNSTKSGATSVGPASAAANGATLGGERLIAWLLRTNRVYGPDATLVTGLAFARAFQGERSQRGVDKAQITRWERGTQRAGFSVIRRYEDLLGLPASRLVVIADTVYRQAEGGAGRWVLKRAAATDPAALRRRTLQLLDRALGDDVMTGQAWDELTVNLWELPGLLLYPESLWNGLATRLLAEMVIADGLQWLYRSEAIIRLLGHPAGELPVIAACAALAADTSSQVVVEPLMVLEASSHPDAARTIVGQIRRPTSEYTLGGAWWAAAEKIGHGHFSPPQRRHLARDAVDVLSNDSENSPRRVAAAELLRQVDPATFADLSAAVRRVAVRDPVSSRVLHSGRTADPEPSHILVNRVGATAISNMSRDTLREDPVLYQLIDEMLFHPQMSRRFVATHTIDASPYRVQVAKALIGELVGRKALGDPTVAPAMIVAVGQCGDSDARAFLERLILGAGPPSATTVTAIRALAHCRGESADAFWTAALQRHGADPEHLRALIYTFGIDRNEAMLHRCAELRDGIDLRAAISWWLRTPRNIAESTRRDQPA